MAVDYRAMTGNRLIYFIDDDARPASLDIAGRIQHLYPGFDRIQHHRPAINRPVALEKIPEGEIRGRNNQIGATILEAKVFGVNGHDPMQRMGTRLVEISLPRKGLVQQFNGLLPLFEGNLDGPDTTLTVNHGKIDLSGQADIIDLAIDGHRGHLPFVQEKEGITSGHKEAEHQ